jgi:hypothetical protein
MSSTDSLASGSVAEDSKDHHEGDLELLETGSEARPPPPGRVEGLDLFRGLAVFFMLLVNFGGTWLPTVCATHCFSFHTHRLLDSSAQAHDVLGRHGHACVLFLCWSIFSDDVSLCGSALGNTRCRPADSAETFGSLRDWFHLAGDIVV